MWIIPYAAIALGVIAVDQISKLLILEYLYQGQVELIPGILNFTYVENRGMSFGWLSDHRWVFMVLSAIAIPLMCFYLWRYVKPRLGRVALAMVIGGAIGNMIDRVAYGFVVDFIDFCAFDFWKWVFNVADTAVCVGAGLFLLYAVLDTVQEMKRQKKAPAAKENEEAGKEDGNGSNA